MERNYTTHNSNTNCCVIMFYTDIYRKANKFFRHSRLEPAKHWLWPQDLFGSIYCKCFNSNF